MDRIYPPFLERIRSARLIPPGSAVVLGFSGGKDSVALALLLQRLQVDLPFRLVLAYLNHGLRSDAAEEESWVRRFAQERGLELRVGHRPVRQLAQDGGLNLEHAASLSRYGFFAQVAGEFPGARIATAHTRSDLAETFLIKLLRGSGLQGLSAIHQRKGLHLIRPLLLFSSAEVLEFLARSRIEHFEDPTNAHDDFLRNRLRHHVLPALREIEPTCEERIQTTVLLIQDEFDYFQRTAELFLRRQLIAGAVLPVAPLKRKPVALVRHLLREYVRGQKGDLLGLSFAHIEALRHALGNRAALSLPGLTVVATPRFLYPQSLRLPGYELVVPGPGRFPLGIGTLAVEVDSRTRFVKPARHTELVVSASRLSFPFSVRCARPEDSYRKINTPHRQRVFEMVRAAGFPVPLRPLAPLVVAGGDGRIVWVYGSPLAADFAVSPGDPGPYVSVSIRGLP